MKPYLRTLISARQRAALTGVGGFVAAGRRACQGCLTTMLKTKSRQARRSAATLRWTALGLLALTALAGAGCSTVRVQPWERAALSDYAMRPDRDPLAGTTTDHTYFSREAAHGGRGVGGSGCGCN